LRQPRVASARQVFFGGRPVPAEEQVRREVSFFKSIGLANGTHKTTAPGRLGDVDDLVCGHFKGRAAVRLLDVGISSGVTTLELLDRLEGQGTRAGGVGVDVCVRGEFCSFLGLDVLYDPEGRVLQVATPLFARGRPHHSLKSVPSKALRLGMDLLESAHVRKWLRGPRLSRPLHLVTARLSGRRGFEVVEHDVTLPRPAWDGSFDLVRAANVLNLDYFPPARLVTMVGNLTSWLELGGLLVLCRTSGDDGSNHGSIYRKRDGTPGLEHVERFGRGHELDPVIRETFCGCG
jgi:hypothetical protein